MISISLSCNPVGEVSANRLQLDLYGPPTKNMGPAIMDVINISRLFFILEGKKNKNVISKSLDWKKKENMPAYITESNARLPRNKACKPRNFWAQAKNKNVNRSIFFSRSISLPSNFAIAIFEWAFFILLFRVLCAFFIGDRTLVSSICMPASCDLVGKKSCHPRCHIYSTLYYFCVLIGFHFHGRLGTK